MGSATFETEVSSEGTITLQVPDHVAMPNQKVWVTVKPVKELTAEEIEDRWKRLKELEGSIPDLDVGREALGPPRDIEPIN